MKIKRCFPVILMSLLVSCAGVPVQDAEAHDGESFTQPSESESVDRVETTEIPREEEKVVIRDLPVLLTVENGAEKNNLPEPVIQPYPPPEYPWEKSDENPVRDLLVDAVIVESEPEPGDAGSEQAIILPTEEATDTGGNQDQSKETRQVSSEIDSKPPVQTADEGTDTDEVSLGRMDVEPGVPFDYTIEKEGWLFEESSPRGAQLIKRTIPAGVTEFTFSVPDKGEYSLSFIRNDIIQGSSERAVLIVAAGIKEDVPEQEWEEAIIIPESEEVTGPPSAEEIVARGFYEALRESDAAVKTGDYQRALAILNLCTDVFSESRDIDRIYFALAELYEQSGPYRDIPGSITFYKKITDHFPASIFFNRASERIIYLERNFVRIR